MSNLKFISTLFLAVVSFAIEVNQQVELTNYMNARYSARFTKLDENKAGILPTGTRGVVQEIKTFASGNSGLLITVTDGEMKNRKVWVYYNKKAPTVKLIDENKQITETPVNADRIQATEPTPVQTVPVTPNSVVGQIDQANRDLVKLNSNLHDARTPACDGCNSSSPGQSGGLPQSNQEITTSLTAGGLYNARINCSYKSDMGITLAGTMKLEIVNNKVTNINATVNGCVVNSDKFRQVEMPNNNVVLEDANGCRVVITSNLKIRTPASTPVLNFGMVPTTDCTKSCAIIEKKYWQVEMNPNSQTCY